jgi:predicted nucleic acid-binding protein
MGVILDSSVVIAAERRRDSVAALIERVLTTAGEQDAALSSVGLTEIVHGVYRSRETAVKLAREAYLGELLAGLTVYPYTKEAAMIAGKIDGEERSRGIIVPFSDLLIGATALAIGFSVMTVNLRHFRLIPGLSVIPM